VFKGLPRCPAVDVFRARAMRWRPARYRLGTLTKTRDVGGVWHVRDTAQ